jgi:hypothetical protein
MAEAAFCILVMGWYGGLGDWAWFEGVNGLPGGGFLISCHDAVLAR